MTTKKRVLLASPAYGAVNPKAAQSLRVAMMSVSPFVEWVGDCSTYRELIQSARNSISFGSLQTEADGIFWIDDDMMLPPEALVRLIQADRDLISGVYFQRLAPHWPLIAFKKKNHYQWLTTFPRNTMIPVDAFGFGICYTSTRMLKHMLDELPDVVDNGWFVYDHHLKKCPHCKKEIPRGFSEDLHFCGQAQLLGYQPWVDTAIMCRHLGEPPEIGIEHHEAWKKETGLEEAPFTYEDQEEKVS